MIAADLNVCAIGKFGFLRKKPKLCNAIHHFHFQLGSLIHYNISLYYSASSERNCTLYASQPAFIISLVLLVFAFVHLQARLSGFPQIPTILTGHSCRIQYRQRHQHGRPIF